MPCTSFKVPMHNGKYIRKYYLLPNVLQIFLWFILESQSVVPTCTRDVRKQSASLWSLGCSPSDSVQRPSPALWWSNQASAVLEPQPHLLAWPNTRIWLTAQDSLPPFTMETQSILLSGKAPINPVITAIWLTATLSSPLSMYMCL